MRAKEDYSVQQFQLRQAKRYIDNNLSFTDEYHFYTTGRVLLDILDTTGGRIRVSVKK